MPLRSRKSIPLPPVSVPTFVFGSPHAPLHDHPVILDAASPDDRFLTLSSYRRFSQQLASGLRNNGLQMGDRVLFVSGNDIAWPVVFMATLMAGGILCGASPALPAPQFLRMATLVEPAFIVASAEALPQAANAAAALHLPHDRLLLFDGDCLFTDSPPVTDTTTARSWRDLLDPGGASFDWMPFISEPDQLAAINYTSGSTGFSKGVMVSHANIISNATGYMEQQKDDPLAPEYGHANTWVTWVPFYHVVGQNQFCVICPKRGIRNYVMHKFELEPLLRYAEKYRPPNLYLLPPVMISLLSHPAAKKYDLGSVRDILVGGAPLRLSLAERFETFMPHENCRVVQGWGMTELTCVVVSRHPNDRSTTQSVGELLPNAEAKIMTPDSSTEITQPYTSGEIWIRGPNVTKGYWRDPERTAQVYMPDGWLRSGDFGYYDDAERLYVSDRIQDVIYPPSAAGVYVLPTDLESALLDIPGVLDAGVTAVSTAGSTDKVPRGFIVLDKSSGATVEGVTVACNSRIKDHERFTGGLFAIDAIPKVPTGKVNRAALRDMEV